MVYVCSAWQIYIYVALWTTISNWSLDILQHKCMISAWIFWPPTYLHVEIFEPECGQNWAFLCHLPKYTFLFHGCNHWTSPFIGYEINQFNCCDILHLMRGHAISVHRPDYSAQRRSFFSQCSVVKQFSKRTVRAMVTLFRLQFSPVQWQNSWKECPSKAVKCLS